MKFTLLLALLLDCQPTPTPSAQTFTIAPAVDENGAAYSGGAACREFDHHTTRAGRPCVCRMLWCGTSRGGMATLWCEP